jgi:hypothetical protein
MGGDKRISWGFGKTISNLRRRLPEWGNEMTPQFDVGSKHTWRRMAIAALDAGRAAPISHVNRKHGER